MCALLGALALAASAAQAKVANDAPNDPDFAGCETQDSVTGCTDSEQWDMFGQLTGNDCPAPVTEAQVLPHPDGGLPCWAKSPRCQSPTTPGFWATWSRLTATTTAFSAR